MNQKCKVKYHNKTETLIIILRFKNRLITLLPEHAHTMVGVFCEYQVISKSLNIFNRYSTILDNEPISTLFDQQRQLTFSLFPFFSHTNMSIGENENDIKL